MLATSAPTIATSLPTSIPSAPTVLATLASGTVSGLSTVVNKNASQSETLLSLIVGSPCIMSGLGFSSSGLTLTVASGCACIGGLVSIASTTYTLPNNQSNIYIWLKQDGTLTHTLTTTPPAGTVVYIGHVATNAGTVTGTHTDGVLYWRCGALWRTTTDAGAPLDSLSSSLRLFTNTSGGTYLWNGAAHLAL